MKVNDSVKKKVFKSAYEIIAALVLLASIPGISPAAGRGPWDGVAGKIGKELQDALRLYDGGKVQDAEEKVVDAYFAVFEGADANMEIAIRQRVSFKRAGELEKSFSDLRMEMHKKAPPPEVKAMALDLSDRVRKAADELDEDRR